MSTENNTASWNNPIIPAWMNTINDNSLVKYREIAPIFGVPVKNFKKKFIARFDFIKILQSDEVLNHLTVRTNKQFKAPDYIVMRDIRALVSRIQNEQ
jgi:hypothetical protein